MIDSPLRLRADVVLTNLTREHASKMYTWMCDPNVSSNLGLHEQPTLSKTLAWVDRALLDPLIKPFALLLSGDYVGNVVLDRLDRYLETARLSVYVGEPSARHAGVGLTGIYLALVEGFCSIGMHKIWLTVHVNNLPAIRTYRRLGFMLEGVLRDEFWFKGRRTNLWYFGLLRHDFEMLNAEWDITRTAM